MCESNMFNIGDTVIVTAGQHESDPNRGKTGKVYFVLNKNLHYHCPIQWYSVEIDGLLFEYSDKEIASC